jgi:hypothetical protein
MNKRLILISILSFVVLAGVYFLFIKTMATMANPTGLKLFVPKEKEENKNIVSDSDYVFNVIAFAEDKFYCYQGNDIKTGKVFTIEKENTVRNFILKTKTEYSGKRMVFIIKPTPEVSYKSTINLLDEMTINDIKRFAMIDVTKQEEAFIKKNVSKNEAN